MSEQKHYSEFAKALKAKYPEYKEIDDRELAEKMIKKYPVYADQVTFDDAGGQSAPVPTPQGGQSAPVPAPQGGQSAPVAVSGGVGQQGAAVAQAVASPTTTLPQPYPNLVNEAKNSIDPYKYLPKNETIKPDPKTGLFTPEIAAGRRGEASPNQWKSKEEGFWGSAVGDALQGMGATTLRLLGNTVDFLDRVHPENFIQEYALRTAAGAEGYKIAERERKANKKSVGAYIAPPMLEAGVALQERSNDFSDNKDFIQTWEDGNYSKALGVALVEGAKSLPTSIAAFTPIGLGVIGLGTMNEKYNEVSQEQDSFGKALVSSVGTASFELLSEKLGAVVDSKLLKSIGSKQGREAAERTIKSLITDYVKTLPKQAITEGLEETASALSTQLLDHSLGLEDKAVDGRELLLSFVYGMGGGLVGGTTMGAAATAAQAPQVRAEQQFNQHLENIINPEMPIMRFDGLDPSKLEAQFTELITQHAGTTLAATTMAQNVGEQFADGVPVLQEGNVGTSYDIAEIVNMPSNEQKEIVKELLQQDVITPENKQLLLSYLSTANLARKQSEAINAQMQQEIATATERITQASTSDGKVYSTIYNDEQVNIVNVPDLNYTNIVNGVTDQVIGITIETQEPGTVYIQTPSGKIKPVSNQEFAGIDIEMQNAQDIIEKITEQVNADYQFIFDNIQAQIAAYTQGEVLQSQPTEDTLQSETIVPDGSIAPPAPLSIGQESTMPDGSSAIILEITPEGAYIVEHTMPDGQVAEAIVTADDMPQFGFNVAVSQEQETAPVASATNEAAQAQETTPVASATTEVEEVPIDDKGNMLFEQASPEATISALSEVFEPNELLATVDAKIADIAKQSAKLAKFTPSGNIQKDIATKQANKQKLDELTTHAAYWQQVRETVAPPAAAPVASDTNTPVAAPEQQAPITPKNIIKRKAINKKGRKREKQWGDVKNLRDLVLRLFANRGQSVRWPDITTPQGVILSRGLGAEYKYSNKERGRYLGLTANDAPTPEQLAHAIWEANAYEQGQFEDVPLYGMDTQDILNEILDILNTYTRGQMIIAGHELNTAPEQSVEDAMYRANQAIDENLAEDLANSENLLYFEYNIDGTVTTLTPEQNALDPFMGERTLSAEEQEQIEVYHNILLQTDAEYKERYNKQQKTQQNDINPIISSSDTQRIEDNENVDRRSDSQSEAIARTSNEVSPIQPSVQQPIVGSTIGSEGDNSSNEGDGGSSDTGSGVVDAINNMQWWRTPLNAEAIAERGVFFASSYEEAEFYGRPNDTPFTVNISNPLVGSESSILSVLNIAPISNPTAEQQFALDAAIKQAAQAQGYDSVVLLSSKGEKSYLKTGKLPKSIELNVFEYNAPTQAQLDTAALDANIGAQKHNSNPTDKQKETGIYDKARINLQGHNITLETLKDSERSGVDSNGKAWSITMNNHYGDLDGTIGYDGDPIDVFVGDNPNNGQIFVIDQVNADGTFDESKVMLGFDSAEAATAAYMSNYEAGWQGFGKITPAGDNFKTWLYDGKKQRKPFSEYKETPEAVEQARPAIDFNNWKWEAAASNAIVIRPNTVGKPFTDEQFNTIMEWGRKNNFTPIRNSRNTRIEFVVDKLDSALVDYIDSVSVKAINDKKAAEEKAKKEELENAKKAALRNAANSNPATSWINSEFGADAMNDYNKNALAKFLNGETKTFEGQVNNKWVDVVARLNALTEDGKGVDFEKLKKSYEVSLQTPDTPSATSGIIGTDKTAEQEKSGIIGTQAIVGTPQGEQIATLEAEKKQVSSAIKKLEKEISDRNGLFGDTKADPNDLFGGTESIDTQAGASKISQHKQRITEIDRQIALLRKNAETGSAEAAGQQSIADIAKAAVEKAETNAKPMSEYEKKHLEDIEKTKDIPKALSKMKGFTDALNALYAKVDSNPEGFATDNEEFKLSAYLNKAGYKGRWTRTPQGERLIFEKAADTDIQFQAIENDNKLVVLHNIRAEGVLNADKLGGLPMPSLAVTKADTPLLGYGEITLIGDKRMVDPQRGTRTFGADIYSARYPLLSYTLSKQGKKHIQNTVEILPVEIQGDVWRGIETSAEEGNKNIYDSQSLKILFLAEQGKLQEVIERQQAPYSQSTIDAITAMPGYDYLDVRNNDEVRKQLTDLYFAENAKLESYRARFTDENGMLNENIMRNMFNEGKRYARVANKVDLINTRRNAAQYIQNNDLTAQWKKYASDYYDQLGVKEEIFKGYTPQGHRKYLSHTIDNVMKAMKTKKLRGAEQFFYGAGSVRARIAPEFKSIADMKANANKLTDSETFEKVKTEIDNKLTALNETLDPFFKLKGNYRGSFTESLADEIVTLANKGQSESFDKLSKEARTELVEFIEMLKNAPTEYFEAKPTREVSLSEFTTAVVPADTEQRVLDILKNAGLNIEQYTDNRAEAVRQASERDNVQFQRISDIGFYSTVEKALEAIAQEKGTKDQFKAMLLKNGAKQAEMDWMGFDELPEKLTKADIQNWIDENRIEVEETEKGQENSDIRYEYSDELTEAAAERKSELQDAINEYEKLDRLDLQGAEHFDKYDEISNKYNVESKENAESELGELENNIDNYLPQEVDYGEDNTKFSEYVLPGGENYKELLLTMPKTEPNTPTFKSSHFDEANIIAHIRFNERTVNGDRVLFIEEVQSDWAQKGKKEGFGDKGYTKEVIPPTEEQMANDDYEYTGIIKDKDGKIIKTFKDFNKSKVEKLLNDAFKFYVGNTTPDMPFKQTPQWVNLAMRRMIRYAAENGFDRIAWTTGEQQADRYDLSKQIKDLEIITDKDDENRVAVWVNNDLFKYANKEELPDIIGKELAQKAISDLEKSKKVYYSSLDLKIGGEGMKAFYDQIIPGAVSKLSKPFGVKVEPINIKQKDNGFTLTLKDNNGDVTTNQFDNKEKAYSWLTKAMSNGNKYEVVSEEDNATLSTHQSIAVTDNMKETAMAGMPLYHTGSTMQPTSPEAVAETVEQLLKTGLAKEVRMVTPEEIAGILEGNEQMQTTLPETIDVDGTARPTLNSNGNPIHSTEEGVRNFWRWFGDSKVVDEQGRPLVVYHGTLSDFDKFKLAHTGKNSDSGMWGKGFYFTTDTKYASTYAKRGEVEGSVMPIYLKIENPLLINEPTDILAIDIPSETEDDFMNGPENYSELFRDKLIEKGNDGVIAYDDEFVVLHPTQIKSATGNDGTFASDNADIRYMRTPSGTIYGFVKDGIVYINSSTPNLNTPIHEFGHLWTDAIEGSELFERGASLVKDTPYWQAVSNNPNYAHLSERAKLKEAMAMAIGDNGEAVKRDIGTFARIKAWIADVWSRIGAQFGIQNLTSAQIQNLTFNDFVDVAVSELMSGSPLSTAQSSTKSTSNTIDVDGTARPTLNSNGKPIHSTAEGIRNFWRWFGDSKVVDEQGRPLVVYHGTKKDARFNVFNQAGYSKSTYFTSDYEIAKRQYTKTDSGNEVFSAYNQIKNPLIVNAGGRFYSKIPTSILPKEFSVDNGRSVVGTEDIAKWAKDNGYDGVIFNSIIDGGTSASNVYSIFSPTQIKSATGNDGGFDGTDPDIRYQVIGERGAAALDLSDEATTRLDNLAVAREMEASKTPTEIRLATGWERGVDGLWRYEVADIEIKREVLEELQTNQYLANQDVRIGSLEYKKDKNGLYSISMVKKGATSINQRAEYKNLTKAQLISLIDNKEVTDKILAGEGEEWGDSMYLQTDFTTFITGGLPLEYVVKDKGLFKAYPELKDIIVVVDSQRGRDAAYIVKIDGQRVIEIGFVWNRTHSSIIHEIQHAIQEIEGFAKGGSIDTSTETNAYEQYSYAAREAKAIIEAKEDFKNTELGKKIQESQDSDTKEWIRLMSERNSSNEDWKFIVNAENNFKKENGILPKEYLNKYPTFENYAGLQYRNLAGETEARNAQSRMAMSDAERRSTLLATTADVAPEDQIVLMETRGTSASIEPPQYTGQPVGQYAQEVHEHNQMQFQVSMPSVPTPPRIHAGMTLAESAKAVADYRNAAKEVFKDVNREMQKISSAYTNFIDRARPLEKYMQLMLEKGAVMNEGADPMGSFATSASRATYMIQQYEKTLIAPLQETLNALVRSKKLDSLGDYQWNVVDEDTGEIINNKKISNYDRISLYLQAKDIVEADTLEGVAARGAEGFEANVHNSVGKGVKPADYIKEFEAAIPAATINTIWEQVRATNHWALDIQLKAGLITQEVYNQYSDGTRQYYVPQRGWRERDLNDSVLHYITDKSDTPDNPFNVALVKARGRRTLAGDPLAYMQSIGESTVMAVLKNETKQEFLKFAEDNADFAHHHDFFAFKRVYYVNTGSVDENNNAVYERTYTAPTKEQIEEDKATNEQLAEIQKIKAEAQANMQNGAIKPSAYAKVIARYAAKERQLRNAINVKLADSEASRIAQVTAAERKQHTVVAIRDGAEYEIVFSQHYGGERVANVINRRFAKDTDTDFEWMQKVNADINKGTRFMSSMMTQYNPAFALTNAVRDFGIASITNLAEQGPAYQLQFMRNIAASQRAVWQYTANNQFGGKSEYSDGKYGKYLQEFFEDGAATGWSFLKDIDQLRTGMQQAIDPTTKQLVLDSKFGVKNVAGLRQAFNMLTEASEITTRLATYITSREATNPDGTAKYTRRQAAIHAKEISVNFDRKGNNKFFGTFFSFFNASVQGTNKLMRMIKDPRVRNIMIGVSASFVAGGLLQGLFMPDPDDDEERAFTEWELMQNICIGKFKMPLPQGLRAFWGVGTQAALAARGSKNVANAMTDAIKYFVGELVPEQVSFWLNGIEIDDRTGQFTYNPTMAIRGVVPTIAQPAYDIWQNTNFMGGTSYRTEFTNRMADTKAERALGKRNVAPAFQDFSNWLWALGGGAVNDDSKLREGSIKTVPGIFDINPSVVQTLIEGYSAGTGRFAFDMYTLTQQILDPKKEVDISTMGFANVFWKQPRDFKPLDKAMIDISRKTDYYKTQFAEIKKANPERYKSILQFHIDNSQLRMDHPEQFARKLERHGTDENKAFEVVKNAEVLSKYVEYERIEPKAALEQAKRILAQYEELLK